MKVYSIISPKEQSKIVCSNSVVRLSHCPQRSRLGDGLEIYNVKPGTKAENCY